MDTQEQDCTNCANCAAGAAWTDAIQRLTRIETRQEAMAAMLLALQENFTTKMGGISTKLALVERLDERQQALAQRVGTVEGEVRDGRKEGRIWSGFLTAATGLLGLLQAAFRK